MKKNLFGWYCLVGLLLTASCKDFIEPSIVKRNVVLQAPADQYLSTRYTVGFWWDEVEDALGYRLQVVSPDFGSPGRLVLDTLVKGYQFSADLDPGDYQWRVRAENGSTQTAYTASRSFSILQSSIKTQSVRLLSPADNLLSNQGQLGLQWSSLFGATRYHIQIDTASFADETKLVSEQTIPGTALNFTIAKDQTYQWRVRAENDTATARWSAVGQFSIDRRAPGRVSLNAPSNAEVTNSPVALQWNTVATATRYKLYILKGDSTSAYSQAFPVLVNGTTYNFTPGSPGDRIYWKVSAIDAAGNEGEHSIMRSFILQ
jgi:hypothetical protein